MHIEGNFYVPTFSPQLLLIFSIAAITIGVCLTIFGLVRRKTHNDSILGLICIIFGPLVIVSQIIQIIIRSL